MKFENTEVWGFKHALRGMRNPMNSWDKGDSVCGLYCDECCSFEDGCGNCQVSNGIGYRIGENDLKLAQKLIRAGAEHRKFMRQIFVSVDITAPLYWWKEFDTYKVGTVANSTSTMHKLATTPITIDCFETYDEAKVTIPQTRDTVMSTNLIVSAAIIPMLEKLRLKYLETKNKSYWKELICWLPEGWLQKRTITMNYENLLAMCSKGQRRFHKLNEWSGIDNQDLSNFISWARSLPYAQELIFIDETENEKGE